MSKTNNNRPGLANYVIDFLVLGLTFYISCLALSNLTGRLLVVQSIAYAMILLLFVFVAQRLIVVRSGLFSGTSRLILGNAAGIAVGTAVMLLLDMIYAGGGEILVALLFSGAMAFFVLGTLTPIVNRKSIPTFRKSSSTH